jgi:hypothetical protein
MKKEKKAKLNLFSIESEIVKKKDLGRICVFGGGSSATHNCTCIETGGGVGIAVELGYKPIE